MNHNTYTSFGMKTTRFMQPSSTPVSTSKVSATGASWHAASLPGVLEDHNQIFLGMASSVNFYKHVQNYVGRTPSAQRRSQQHVKTSVLRLAVRLRNRDPLRWSASAPLLSSFYSEMHEWRMLQGQRNLKS